MNKLDTLIETFENDKNWNTLERNGKHRFDEKIIWIRKMVQQYAEKLNMSIDNVVDDFEKNRDYSWPNYYQEANFPNLDNMENINIYETLEEFRAENKKFKCPSCGNVYSSPTQCEHLIKKDGKCDWTAGGLFKLGLQYVIVKEIDLTPMRIFKTVKD